MITIINYGASNLASVRRAFEHLGADVNIAVDARAVDRAEKLVLPGVGHFAATAALQKTGMHAAIVRAIDSGKPLLGICLGMQWLFEGSSEAPELTGAGVFRGRCSSFPTTVKSPHVGWNTLEVRKRSRLLKGVSSDAFVYYTHSFAAPGTDEATAVTQYGLSFAGAVERDTVFGVQFHPEKSGQVGLTVLKNFCTL